MTLTLYYKIYSPPCRATIFTLLALNLTYEERITDLNKTNSEQYEEFLMKNPHGTIPTIVDDDFVLWDSHAINSYLANKYDKTNRLYPVDPRQRAMVDHRLCFDNEVLFPLLRGLSRQIVRQGKVKEITDVHVNWFNEAYNSVDNLFVANTIYVRLKKWKFIAGDQLTIADFHYVTTLTTMEIFVPIDKEKFPALTSYLSHVKSAFPNYTLNEIGVEEFRKYVSIPDFKLPPHNIRPNL